MTTDYDDLFRATATRSQELADHYNTTRQSKYALWTHLKSTHGWRNVYPGIDGWSRDQLDSEHIAAHEVPA